MSKNQRFLSYLSFFIIFIIFRGSRLPTNRLSVRLPTSTFAHKYKIKIRLSKKIIYIFKTEILFFKAEN